MPCAVGANSRRRNERNDRSRDRFLRGIHNDAVDRTGARSQPDLNRIRRCFSDFKATVEYTGSALTDIIKVEMWWQAFRHHDAIPTVLHSRNQERAILR